MAKYERVIYMDSGFEAKHTTMGENPDEILKDIGKRNYLKFYDHKAKTIQYINTDKITAIEYKEL